MAEVEKRKRRNRRYRLHARKPDGAYVDYSSTRPLPDDIRERLGATGFTITRDVVPDTEVRRG